MSYKLFCLSPRAVLIGIALFSLASLGVAYGGDYFFDLKPCVLCLYQRYIYMGTLAVALLGSTFSTIKRLIQMIFATAFLFFTNFSIALYQVLVEKKIVELPAICKGVDITTQNQTFAQFKEILVKADTHVACDAPPFELFGLSIAGYNALLTLLGGLACLFMATLFYRFLHKYRSAE